MQVSSSHPPRHYVVTCFPFQPSWWLCEVVPLSSLLSRWRCRGLNRLCNMPKVTQWHGPDSNPSMCYAKECVMPNRTEGSLTFCPAERHCFPWVLIAGRLSQNQVRVAAAAGLLVGGGRESCVCARASAGEREMILWSLILGRASIWGWVVWWANHDNTPQIAMACSKGTMTGLLYFSACLCNFIIDVSESSFYCLPLSLAIASPFPTSSPCDSFITNSAQLSKAAPSLESLP